MQLFTQLWPAVIEILSVVLCDYCSNEFSMAVIFSLLVFPLQVKTCTLKMMKTTQIYPVNTQISPNCLIVSFKIWTKCSKNQVLWNLFNLVVVCFFFLISSIHFLLPQQPVNRIIIHLKEFNSCQHFILKALVDRPTTKSGMLATMTEATVFFLIPNHIKGK